MQVLSTWLDGGESFPKYGGSDIFSYPQGVRIEGQDYLPDYAPLAPPLSLSTTINPTGALFDPSGLPNAPEPTAEDLEHYRMSIFLHVKTHTDLATIT